MRAVYVAKCYATLRTRETLLVGDSCDTNGGDEAAIAIRMNGAPADAFAS